MQFSVESLRTLLLKRVISAKTYCKLKPLVKRNCKRKNLRIRYTRKPFLLSRYSNDECLIYFRFSAEEIDYLLQTLEIPCMNVLKNRIKFSGTYFDSAPIKGSFVHDLDQLFNLRKRGPVSCFTSIVLSESTTRIGTNVQTG